MQWKELNVINASYKTVYNRFLLWTKQNIFQQAYLILLNKYIESKKKWKKITSYSTDTTFIKNIFGYNCVGKNPTDRGRMASKISVIVDNLGIPFSLQMHEGNKNDCILLDKVLDNMFYTSNKILPFFADKGYDTKHCRQIITDNGFVPKIPKNKKGSIEDTIDKLVDKMYTEYN